MQAHSTVQAVPSTHGAGPYEANEVAAPQRRASSPSEAWAPPASQRPTSASGVSSDHFTSLDERIARATEHNNAGRPRQALDLLAPVVNTEAAKANFGFQSRLGVAYMDVADELVAAGKLGAFLVTSDASGNWRNANVHAERISCYLGVLGAYGTLMQLLQVPTERARFIEKNDAETLDVVEDGVRAGLTHAMLEPILFIRRICQINSNNASRDFVNQAVATGALSPTSSPVGLFRQVQADTLYQPIVTATAVVDQAARDAGEVPQLFWLSWMQAKTQDLLQLPAYKLAQQYAALPPGIGS